MRGYRVGVVSPRSPFGRRVRDLLDEGRLPVIELKLLESELQSGASLTQFGDDVVITQPLDADLFPHLDVLFFGGEDSDVFNRMARDAADEGVLTLVEGAVGLDAPVLAPGLAEAELPGGERLGILPRMPSYLLGVTLDRIAQSFAIARASATVLLPAHEWGEPGAEELHQQVVNLLNFKPPPMEVFREQVAFNVKVAGSSASAAPLAEAVAFEAARLCGLPGILTVSLVQVPVFHGYAASLWVELEEPADERAFAACFRSAPFVKATGASARSPSPVGVAESEKIHIGSIRRPGEVGRSGFWIWVVADTTAYDPGTAAIDVALANLS